jgi:MFS family permease
MAENSDTGQGPRSRGGIAQYPLFAVAAVLLGAFLANFDSRLTSVGLPDLRGAFSLGFDEGAWLSTASIGSQIFIAPAVAWLATAFGLRRVLGIPSLVYALISLVIPFVRDYPALIALSIVHGMLLGTFVPATLMIIFRNLPIRWWLPAIAIYSIRVGFALDTGTSLVGFYVDHWGWQWLYWQGVLIAPLMGLMVYLGTPPEPVNQEVLRDADWGGMLLLGTGVSMIYAGLDQGNRLDWLESGTVAALIIGGGLLCVAFLINEMIVRRPWAHVNVLFSRNVGLSLIVILLYTLTSLSNSSLLPNFLAVVGQLRPEQTGVLLVLYGAVPMFVLVPVSIFLLRHLDPRFVLIIGLSAFAAANLLGTQLTHDWALGDGVRGLYPGDAARRRGDRRGADGHLAARPRASPFQLSRPASSERQRQCRPDPQATLRRLCQPWCCHRAGARTGVALGAGAAGVERACLYRRLLADVLAGDGRAWFCDVDDQSAARPVHPGAIRRGAGTDAAVRIVAGVRAGSISSISNLAPCSYPPSPEGGLRRTRARGEGEEITPPARWSSAPARSVPAAVRSAACACGP